MLVALASFVLHGGAMASLHSHKPLSGASGLAAPTGHVHSVGAHDHASALEASSHHHGGVAAVHDHDASAASDGPVDADGVDHASSADASCCGSACASALQAFGPTIVWAPMTVAVSLQPASQGGSGIDPNGFRRPPRPSSIA